MNKERFFAKPWPFNCEKPIAIAICGKCLVQASNFTSMSITSLLENNFLMRYYLNWWKKQNNVCFTKIGKLYIYNSQF